MKFFIKMFALFLFCTNGAFAQKVLYTMEDGAGNRLGSATFNYNKNGYVATVNGQKMELKSVGDTTKITIGKLVVTIFTKGEYLPKRVGYTETFPITTSFGDSGYTMVRYDGIKAEGRRYQEETWLNGQLFSKSENLLDHNDQIIWAVVSDSAGVTKITRN